MLRVERGCAMNFDNAIRGARNPMNSWEKSDSYYDDAGSFVMGEADLAFGERLVKAGPDHRKFIRQIFVSVDITAPLYWWKEFDTYKVGTVANSCSTMHKIHSKPFERDDFSHDKMSPAALECLDVTIEYLEKARVAFVETKEKSYWHDMIQLLPTSFNQMRTVTLNYENLINIYNARCNHKLDEWHVLCDWILTLPYADRFIVPALRNKE